ncbi:MAG: dihydrofolate reductase family protein [Segetibacter sp.]
MRKIIVSMNVTLDGFMAGPDCELDWHFKCWTKDMGEALCRQLSQADTILLGRITYSAMAKYWPSKINDPSLRGEDFAFADMMNNYFKIVFSGTLTNPVWNNSKPVNGNFKDEITALKKQPGKDMIVYGSGKLVNALMHFSLVDEYQLWVHPVILGKGKLLFSHLHERLDIKLVNSKTFSSGVILLHYQTIKINNNENNKQTKRRILKGQF